MNTNTIDKQSRIEMALKFFNLLFGAVVERLFDYLWTKQDKTTYPFAVSYSDERIAMAKNIFVHGDYKKLREEIQRYKKVEQRLALKLLAYAKEE